VQPSKVVVVDDSDRFRRFVISTMGQKAEYQVIAQALDGLEAVQLAEQLQPDLILLDIGLPKLNGIETARQIREVAPLAKILFLSVESSSEVVQEALRVGAMGYVSKVRAKRDLLPAIGTILAGGQFVSRGLEGWESAETTTDPAPHHHEVLF
jgi:DNA-binding NarL/FixJ family response regulator